MKSLARKRAFIVGILLLVVLSIPIPFVYKSSFLCECFVGESCNCPEKGDIGWKTSPLISIYNLLSNKNTLIIPRRDNNTRLIIDSRSDTYCASNDDCVFYRSPFGDPAGKISCLSMKQVQKYEENDNSQNILTEEETASFPFTCQCDTSINKCFKKDKPD